jgi:hypothetical protein
VQILLSIVFFLPPLFQVLLEAESIVAWAAEPEVVFWVAVPETVVWASERAGLAPVFAAAELSAVVVAWAAEPEVVFLSAVSVADIAEPQASVDIAVVFVVLVPVSVVVGEIDSSVRPKFPAFPNADHFASASSSVEVVGEEPAHNPTGARANYGLCSSLSNLGLHQNKNVEHCHNNSSFDYNTVSDTNDLPMDATTNHSRKRVLYQCQEKRRHSSQVSLSPLGDRQIKCVEAEEC